MRLHSGEKPFDCKLCPAKFTQFVHLKLHRRLHTNERPYECPKCARKYISASGLKTHWKTSRCMPEDSNVEMAQISPLGSPIESGEYSGMPAFPNGTPFFYDAPHINGLDLRGSDGESEHSTSDNGDETTHTNPQTEESESFNAEEEEEEEEEEARSSIAETNETDNNDILSHNSTEHSSIIETTNIEVSAEA